MAFLHKHLQSPFNVETEMGACLLVNAGWLIVVRGIANLQIACLALESSPICFHFVQILNEGILWCKRPDNQ